MKDLYIDLMYYLEQNYPHEKDLMRFVHDCQNGNVPYNIQIAVNLYHDNYLDIIDDYLDWLDGINFLDRLEEIA